MAEEADKYLDKFLFFVQSNKKLRMVAAGLLVVGIMVITGYLIFDAMPRTFHIKVSGGELIGNRHYLARVLQDEGMNDGLILNITGTSGTFPTLEALDNGTLDMAFIQGGLDLKNYANIEHVATLNPELLHFLVRPGIKKVEDLKGRVINFGPKNGGTRVVAKKVLEFSGLDDASDYGEVNINSEQLVNMKPQKMPDAVALLSYAPSFIVDYLVKQRGYTLLEIPFPPSLALREGWVASGNILSYTYSVSPPVPQDNLQTIGVNLSLVANANTDPRAIMKTLEILYSPSYQSRVRMKFDDSILTQSNGLPLSQGTVMYLNRNDPIISTATVGRIQSLFGALMGIASTILLVLKWFKGPEEKEKTNDEEFKNYVAKVLKIEEELLYASRNKNLTKELIVGFEERLTDIKTAALTKYPSAVFADSALFDRLIASIEDTRINILNYKIVMG